MGGYNRKYVNSPHDSKENRSMYDIWEGMKRRCYNEKYGRYKDYGGRGITICDEWLDFDVFVEWARNNGFQIGLSIDRIDNDGDYCPENCRWATVKVQNRNKRTCIMVEYKGKCQSLMDWCEELSLPYYTIQKRIKKGMDPVRAIEKPVYDNSNSFAKMCKKYGMSDRVVRDRVNKLGWDLERALSTPVKKLKRCAS